MDLPVAIVGRVAFSDALLQGGHDEGVHKVSLALVCLVTISGWATENNKKWCAIIVGHISLYHTILFSLLYSQLLSTDAIGADHSIRGS